jgi:hypothetical protein
MGWKRIAPGLGCGRSWRVASSSGWCFIFNMIVIVVNQILAFVWVGCGSPWFWLQVWWFLQGITAVSVKDWSNFTETVWIGLGRSARGGLMVSPVLFSTDPDEIFRRC